jgi:hypothetical protein
LYSVRRFLQDWDLWCEETTSPSTVGCLVHVPKQRSVYLSNHRLASYTVLSIRDSATSTIMMLLYNIYSSRDRKSFLSPSVWTELSALSLLWHWRVQSGLQSRTYWLKLYHFLVYLRGRAARPPLSLRHSGSCWKRRQSYSPLNSSL